jgi:hypothetical protein
MTLSFGWHMIDDQQEGMKSGEESRFSTAKTTSGERMATADEPSFTASIAYSTCSKRPPGLNVFDIAIVFGRALIDWRGFEWVWLTNLLSERR